MNRPLTPVTRYREALSGKQFATGLVMLAFFALATFINPNAAVAQTRQTDSSGRKIVTRVEPEYPETLKRLYIGGIVRIKVTVNPSGKVETTELLGGNPILGQSAVRAVKQWRYAQAPSKESVTVQLEFDPHR
jgi:TonB family protein